MNEENLNYELRKIKREKVSLKGYIPNEEYFFHVYNGIGTIITISIRKFTTGEDEKTRKFRRFIFSNGVDINIDENGEFRISKGLKSLYDSLKEDKYYVIMKGNYYYKLIPFSKIKELKISEEVKESIYLEREKMESMKKRR